MDEILAASPDPDKGAAADLAERLARYRRRVEAEGRLRALGLIDRAIEAADRKAKAGR